MRYGFQASQCLVKSGLWKTTDFENSNIFYFMPLVGHFDPEYQYVILDKRFVISNRSLDTSVQYGIDINGQSIKVSPAVFSQIIGLKPGLNDCHLYSCPFLQTGLPLL